MAQPRRHQMHQIKKNSEHRNEAIQQAITAGLSDYFTQQEAVVADFVKAEFLYPGCWHNNKQAFGWDLIRAPINLFWAPLYLALRLLFSLAGLAGWKSAKQYSQTLPIGFCTTVQRQINHKYLNKLINREALTQAITLRLEQIPNSTEAQLQLQQLHSELKSIVSAALEQLMLSRTAHADIGNTLFSTALGALAFKKFTPGGLGLGLILAAFWVKKRAEDEFWLGETLGTWYYALLPPQPNTSEQIMGVVAVLLLLAVLASFSGLLIAPLLPITGSPQRRLKRLLKKLHHDLLNRCGSQYRTLDPYIARILELIDTIKAQFSI